MTYIWERKKINNASAPLFSQQKNWTENFCLTCTLLKRSKLCQKLKNEGCFFFYIYIYICMYIYIDSHRVFIVLLVYKAQMKYLCVCLYFCVLLISISFFVFFLFFNCQNQWGFWEAELENSMLMFFYWFNFSIAHIV